MQVCTSLQTDNHTSTPPLTFLQAGCPSCHPNNSVKALKVNSKQYFREKQKSDHGCDGDSSTKQFSITVTKQTTSQTHTHKRSIQHQYSAATLNFKAYCSVYVNVNTIIHWLYRLLQSVQCSCFCYVRQKVNCVNEEKARNENIPPGLLQFTWPDLYSTDET